MADLKISIYKEDTLLGSKTEAGTADADPKRATDDEKKAARAYLTEVKNDKKNPDLFAKITKVKIGDAEVPVQDLVESPAPATPLTVKPGPFDDPATPPPPAPAGGQTAASTAAKTKPVTIKIDPDATADTTAATPADTDAAYWYTKILLGGGFNSQLGHNGGGGEVGARFMHRPKGLIAAFGPQVTLGGAYGESGEYSKMYGFRGSIDFVSEIIMAEGEKGNAYFAPSVGVHGGQVGSPKDNELTPEDSARICDASEGGRGGNGSCFVPSDTRKGDSGLEADGLTLQRDGWYLGPHVGVEFGGEYKINPATGIGVALGGEIGTSVDQVSGHNEGDDPISVGPKVEGRAFLRLFGRFDLSGSLAGSNATPGVVKITPPKPKDGDGDGVVDADDKCHNPANKDVDATGCPKKPTKQDEPPAKIDGAVISDPVSAAEDAQSFTVKFKDPVNGKVLSAVISGGPKNVSLPAKFDPSELKSATELVVTPPSKLEAGDYFVSIVIQGADGKKSIATAELKVKGDLKVSKFLTSPGDGAEVRAGDKLSLDIEQSQDKTALTIRYVKKDKFGQREAVKGSDNSVGTIKIAEKRDIQIGQDLEPGDYFVDFEFKAPDGSVVTKTVSYKIKKADVKVNLASSFKVGDVLTGEISGESGTTVTYTVSGNGKTSPTRTAAFKDTPEKLDLKVPGTLVTQNDKIHRLTKPGTYTLKVTYDKDKTVERQFVVTK